MDILFVVPYPELEPVVQEVYRDYPEKDKVTVEFKVMTVDMVRQYKMEREYDVLVGRNFTLEELKRQYPTKPVINIPITGYDIVQALYEAKKMYHCRKVGIVGRFFHMYQYEHMEEITGVKTSYHPVDQGHDLEYCVAEAVSQGCDCIIGGYSAYLYLKNSRTDLPVVTIKVSRETIFNVLEEAVHIAEEVKKEKEKSELFRIITQISNAGIFYVNDKGQIEIANREARKLFPNVQTLFGWGGGAYLRQIAPFMQEEAERCFESGERIADRVYLREGTSLSTDFLPVKIGNSMPGLVVSFMNASRIQQMENQIRRQMSDKGLAARYTFQDIVHKSDIMDRTIENAGRYAGVSSNVLLVGETGTGKELFAQSIHNASKRAGNAFVAVNCAALPESLLESELFGYVEGAFTGSKKGGKMGLFEMAH